MEVVMRSSVLLSVVAFIVLLVAPVQSNAGSINANWGDGVNVTELSYRGSPYGYGYKGGDGSVFVYYSVRTSTGYKIYIQKIDRNGNELWGPDGSFVSAGEAYNDFVPDDTGGGIAIIPGSDGLRAKRFDGNGNEDLSWGIDGVLITSDRGSVQDTSVSDGAGGAIAVFRGSNGYYAQRVGADGELKWGGGEPVYVGEIALYHSWTQADNAVPDGAGGVFIGGDYRDKVIVQHIDSNGDPQWGAGGVVALEAPGAAFNAIIPDGTGGAIISAYTRYSDRSTRVSRVDGSGNLVWGSGGVILRSNLWHPFGTKFSSMEDVGGGEFVIAFDGTEAADSYDITSVYVQKFDLDGDLKWDPMGINVSVEEEFNFFPKTVSDGAGGVWVSFIHGEIWGADTHIGVQHVDGDGNPFLCDPFLQLVHNENETWGHSLDGDGAGGVYSIWGGSDAGNDIYGQRFTKEGARQTYCGGAIPVVIDIKPGSDRNPVNLNSGGVTPVAVLTTDDFDATMLDGGTVTLAGATARHSAVEDVDGDGDLDMIFHVPTRELSLDGTATSATLEGVTLEGIAVFGSDAVDIVPKKR